MENAKRHRVVRYRSTSWNNSRYEPDYREHARYRNRRRQSPDRDIVAFLVLIVVCVLSLKSGNSSPDTEPVEDDDDFVSRCENLLPDCECDDLSEVIGIYCHNISDFEHFNNVLVEQSFYDEKEEGVTYEISLSGTRIMPRQFLKGLIVYRLYIDDAMTTGLEKGAFDGILRLRRFHVRISSLTEIPDFLPVRDSLRNLNLDNSLLTAVDGEQLKNLSLLETFSAVNNSIAYVAEDAFQGTESIIIFDMSNNRLQFLPPNLFDPWKKLKKAVLSNNRLKHVNQLFALTHPQFIYLDHNNLSDLDFVLHPNMFKVETVQLSYNEFERVTVNSFNGKLNRCRFIYLDHCLIKEFNASHYEKLGNLAVLDLSYNLIEKVVNQSIDFGTSLELDFTGNKITEFNDRLPYNVKRVYLNNNLMTTLGSTLQFSQMAQVSMADNRIESLRYQEFHGVHGIVSLDMQGNLIGSIESGTFKKSIRKSLTYLDLSRNRIRKLNGCIQLLSLLTSLNLTDNQIEGFDVGEFQGLNELTDLYLKGNRIKTLGNELMLLNSLKNLMVSDNRIRTIKGHQLPKHLQYVYVEGNPLQCDCQMLSFLERLNSTENLRSDVPLCIPSSNKSLETSARCPEGCQCFCNSNAGSHYITVDCSHVGLTQLPPLFAPANATTLPEHNSTSLVVFLSRNMGRNTFFSESAPFVIEDEIGGVDLSHNHLKSVEDARLPQHTKELLLGHNLIRQPPTALLYSLEELNTVTLSGNPWACDCGTTGFKKWILSHSEFILDANETRCDPEDQDSSGLANRAISTLTDLDLCPTSLETSVAVVFGVLSLFLVAAAMMIAWTRYQISIKVWLFTHGVTWVKERDLDQDKAFDAFFSFSSKDQNLVILEIINVIQKKAPNVRLLLHYRDFIPGALIEDNIMRAVHHSKRTILVLSRNFLLSEWCMAEFKYSHMQALKDNINRIIIIILGDLPEKSKIPEDIQMYLKYTTCLMWGEKYFWDKLFYTLPTSSSPRPNKVDTYDAKEKYHVCI